MTETYEDARKRLREKREQYEDELRDRVFQLRSEADIDTEDAAERWSRVQTILTATPDTMAGGSSDGEVGGGYLDPSVDMDFGSMDQRGLLEIIARGQLAQLSTLLDIADYTAIPTNVTVSGSEIIDNPEVSQSVVPGAEAGDIPTRTLFLRASVDNTSSMAIGDDAVSPDDGFVLRPGESITIDIDLRDTDLYMASGQADQVINIIGVY